MDYTKRKHPPNNIWQKYKNGISIPKINLENIQWIVQELIDDQKNMIKSKLKEIKLTKQKTPKNEITTHT